MKQPDTAAGCCWFYPWCIIVRVHSAPCEGTLTAHSSDTDRSLTAFCFLPPSHTHTHTHRHTHMHKRAKFLTLLYFTNISQSSAKTEEIRIEPFSTLKGGSGIIRFPTICTHVYCSEQTPHTGHCWNSRGCHL